MRTSVMITSKELNGAEAMALVDYKKQTKISKALENGDLAVTIDYIALLRVEDEKGEKPAFDSYVFATTDKKFYVCGSYSLFKAVLEKLMESMNAPVAVTITKKVSTKDPAKTYFTLA